MNGTKHRAQRAPESILVYVGLDRLGDSLLKLAFVRGLREAFPDARITWVAGKDTSLFASVFAPLAEGLIDEVIERAGIGLSPAELLSRPLGGRRFDMIIDTQRVLLPTLVLWRIPHRSFISPSARFLFSSVKPPKGYRFPKPMLHQLMDLLEFASGHRYEPPATLDLALPDNCRTEAQRLLPGGETYVGLAPGAGGRPKCWPLERFIETGRNQLAAGRRPVFILGPQESDWVDQVRAAVPDALYPLQDGSVPEALKGDPLLTIALAERLDVTVSNDSGIGHMIAAAGTPLISLFGPTNPEKFPPMTRALTLIRAQDFGGDGMEFIPLDAVGEAIDGILAPEG
jgi:ADP-heptose:LPS heptosyltransferase